MPEAFVLHRYPYKETSLLLKVFTRDQGIISLITKNAKKKKSDSYSLLQCFQPLKMDYNLKGELGNLKQVERNGEAAVLHNEHLYSAFYLNELLLFLLHPHDAAPAIFDLYARTLMQIEGHMELSLRLFELNLLNHLGFLPDFRHDEAGDALQMQANYLVTPGHLPRLSTQESAAMQSYLFSGADLKSFIEGNWTPESLKAAKRLCRVFIEQHTRGKVFKSRELFAAAKELSVASVS